MVAGVSDQRKRRRIARREKTERLQLPKTILAPAIGTGEKYPVTCRLAAPTGHLGRQI
jgi:hypothetical protein